MIEFVMLSSACVSIWGFVCAAIVPWKIENQADALAGTQRFIMIGGFYGWLVLNLGGYV